MRGYVCQVQLSLCGQEPETALSSALASVKFYIQQKELDANLLQNKLSVKVDRVQEACKRKLQVRSSSSGRRSCTLEAIR